MQIRRNDGLLAAGAVLLSAVGTLAAWGRFDALYRTVVLFFLAGSWGLLVWFFRKLSDEQAAQHQRTVELLDALHQPLSDIHPRFPLPPLRVPGNWTATPDFVRLLNQLIIAERPAVMVELGSGVSSLVTGYALEKNGGGHLYSLDHDRRYAEQSRQQLQRHRLTAWVDVIDAPLVQHDLRGEKWTWYDLAGLRLTQPIDLLVVDGPPPTGRDLARYPALPLLLAQLSDRAVILMDDGIRPDERRIVERWLQEFPGWQSEYLHTEKGSFILRRQ